MSQDVIILFSVIFLISFIPLLIAYRKKMVNRKWMWINPLLTILGIWAFNLFIFCFICETEINDKLQEIKNIPCHICYFLSYWGSIVIIVSVFLIWFLSLLLTILKKKGK